MTSDADLRGSDLPRLAWTHPHPYDARRCRPIANKPGWPVKPSGGLWTAPLTGDGGTAWTDWCRLEGFGDWPTPRRLTLINPDPDAVVYRIDDLQDLLELQRRHSLPPDMAPPSMTIWRWPLVDWEKAATQIDAVWLTARGQHETRFSEPGLYGWDCETVLWLQPSFTAEAQQ